MGARKELANAIIASLRLKPEDWTLDRDTVDHKSGVEVWFGNGRLFVEVWRPEIVKFSLLQKWRIYTAAKKVRAHHRDDAAKRVLAQFLSVTP